MTHKDAILQQINKYSKDHPQARFIGYNTLKGSRMYGTLNDVPDEQCIETPVAENLMMSLAFGLCLEGYRPVVCLERHDFLLLALDSLVNHIDKLPIMGRYKLPIIVRAIVGANRPLNPGPQHTQDYTAALQLMLKNTPVYAPRTKDECAYVWSQVGKTDSGAVVIIEERNIYDNVLQ
jgi:2-oxoisovalerate dehydrogenase E1 component beta subunit